MNLEKKTSDGGYHTDGGYHKKTCDGEWNTVLGTPWDTVSEASGTVSEASGTASGTVSGASGTAWGIGWGWWPLRRS